MGLFSSIFARGEQAKSDDLDKQLADLNAQRLESGYYTPEHYQLVEEQRSAGKLNVEAEVRGAFVEGAKEGVANVRNSIGDTINAAVKTIAGLLPWQVWLILIGVGLFYAWPVIGPIIGARLAKRS